MKHTSTIGKAKVEAIDREVCSNDEEGSCQYSRSSNGMVLKRSQHHEDNKEHSREGRTQCGNTSCECKGAKSFISVGSLALGDDQQDVNAYEKKCRRTIKDSGSGVKRSMRYIVTMIPIPPAILPPATAQRALV